MSETQRDSQLDIVTEAERPKLAPPPLHKVVMINDDFTPMGFVVEVLQSFFHHAREKAVQIMLQVHTQGRAVAGIYPVEIAETKAAQVSNHARKHQHPLMCVTEKV